MRRLLAVLVMVALATTAVPSAAQTTGEIYGKVTDASGSVLPGAVVTITSTVLLQPQTAVTTANGTYRFPALPIGVYSVRFEMEGFRTMVREGLRLEIGLNAQVNQALEISAIEEAVSVTAESPLVDVKDTSRTTRFTQEALQSIPSARDPWVILEQSAGVAMDRENIGGNMSGQQSNFVSRGAAMAQQKWKVDGIDITDMAATGASPVYYDFDAFEEMQITTGGVDVTMQSPGVGREPRDQERHGSAQGLGPLLRHRRPVPVDQHHRRPAQAGRDVRQPDPEHQGLRHRGRRPDQEGAARGSGAATASATSTSA